MLPISKIKMVKKINKQTKDDKWITKLKVRIVFIEVDPKYLHKSAALYDKYK